MAASVQKKEKPGFFARYLPIVTWLPHYNKAWLSGDFIAGLSVWALMVPQALGYATISGVPVEYGLYAAMIALLVFPLFTTSRHVITGPSSTISAVTGAAVLSVAAAGSEEAVQVAALITVIAGLIYLFLAVLKMGWISNFLSESVLTGFIFGIGIDVVIGQLDNLTGSPQADGNSWQEFFSWLTNLSESNPATVVVGLGALILLVVLKLYAPKVPGALIAVLLGIGAAVVFDLGALGVDLVGEVPRGLPSLTMPSWSLLTEYGSVIVTAAIGVMLVGFSESLAAAKQYASKYHYDIDTNQEMLAQGMANTASGLFQGINVDGSLSKSSLNDSSGAKTELASIFQGFFVLLTLLFLAPMFSNLPEAVLGAIVIEAVAFGLFKIAEMKQLWKVERSEFWLALAALLGVLTFGTLQGVIIGVALSLLLLIARASRPHIPVLGQKPDTHEFHSVEDFPDLITYPGIMIIRFDGPLYFATSNSLRNRIRDLTTDVEIPVTAVIMDMESTPYVDLQAAEELANVAGELRDRGVRFYLARTRTAVIQILQQVEVFDEIGSENMFELVVQAVAAEQQLPDTEVVSPNANNGDREK